MGGGSSVPRSPAGVGTEQARTRNGEAGHSSGEILALDPNGTTGLRFSQQQEEFVAQAGCKGKPGPAVHCKAQARRQNAVFASVFKSGPISSTSRDDSLLAANGATPVRRAISERQSLDVPKFAQRNKDAATSHLDEANKYVFDAPPRNRVRASLDLLTSAQIRRKSGAFETVQGSGPSSCMYLPEALQKLDATSQPRRIVRFIFRKDFMELQQLPAFEQVKDMAHVDIPYKDIADEMWQSTVVISWRWHRAHPLKADPGFSPMSHEQLEELKAILGALGPEISYVWIDFACVPQKISVEGPCMSEVMRSRLYFAKARQMVILPSLVRLPEKNTISDLLRGAVGQLERFSRNSRGSAEYDFVNVQRIRLEVERLLHNPVLCKRDYFMRAWTMVERMARSHRKERLQHWMPLRLWIGLVADMLWASYRGEEMNHFPWHCFDPVSARTLNLRLSRCCNAAVQGSQFEMGQSAQLYQTVALLFMDAFLVWQAPLTPQEFTVEWLRKYVTVEATVAVKAADWRDTIWAVYGSFIAKGPRYTDVKAAALALCKIANVPAEDTTWSQRGLIEFPSPKPLIGSSGSSMSHALDSFCYAGRTVPSSDKQAESKPSSTSGQL